MLALPSVDAKMGRARTELRLLKADIAAFCEEKARLIMREPDAGGERERWVYRGDTPQPPIEWSIRAGEFAYNLRSALDHLVWKLVEVNGETPDKHNEFPIYINGHNGKGVKRQLRGVSRCTKDYIKSVQPYRHDPAGIGRGLALLHEICNMDKHRHLLIANARWTGEHPKSVTRASFHPIPKQDERSYWDTDRYGYVKNCELQNGQALLVMPLFDGQYLQFKIDAFFDDDLPFSEDVDGRKISVSETLDACMDSVEMVVGRLRSVS